MSKAPAEASNTSIGSVVSQQQRLAALRGFKTPRETRLKQYGPTEAVERAEHRHLEALIDSR
jgi:hypothetical protein